MKCDESNGLAKQKSREQRLRFDKIKEMARQLNMERQDKKSDSIRLEKCLYETG